jgi:hypothetical protein
MNKYLKLGISIVVFVFLVAFVFAFYDNYQKITAKESNDQKLVVDSSSCEQMAKQFVSDRGFANSGQDLRIRTNFNTKLQTCFVGVDLKTKWKNGDPDIKYFFNLYDLTNKTNVATFQGIAPDPEDNPEATVCVIRGTTEHTCKNVQEYMLVANNLLTN